MKHKIETPEAPQAIGPYSQAIKIDKTIYFSGQIPLHPKTMALVSEDFTEQARQVLTNLRAVSVAAGGSLEHIVKLTIYLTDLMHFSTLNDLMIQFFKPPYPARSTVQVVALPKAAKIEIEAVMVLEGP
ncbi:MAG: reactive intermediate/imine deaminase [Gammaproteobacteria bacterium RIFCSPHIGHO2_12_FULL_37_34]|nr:MAG: reactive intermediate/imine deaminase [Gammaproteobacteria bacterium RIFCSPHIGHO2_12_FULL_37_34]